MNKKITGWVSVIENSIRELQADYSINKGLLLTEGDLECELYRRLTLYKDFCETSATKTEGWSTNFVHSQVTWFRTKTDGTHLDSGFEVDLTIFDPANLDVQTFENENYYPNKGYFHDGECIGIEVKFIRDQSRSKVISAANCDYIKVVDRLDCSKRNLITSQRYTNVTMNDVAFIIVVGCKTETIYDLALETLERAVKKREMPQNVIAIIFSHTRFTKLSNKAAKSTDALSDSYEL